MLCEDTFGVQSLCFLWCVDEMDQRTGDCEPTTSVYQVGSDLNRVSRILRVQVKSKYILLIMEDQTQIECDCYFMCTDEFKISITISRDLYT